MFGVYKGCYAALLRRVGYCVERHCCLTGTFRTEDFHYSPAGVSAHTERGIQKYTSRRYYIHRLRCLVAEFHYRTFSKIFFYLSHCGLKGFQLFVNAPGSFFVLFCHIFRYVSCGF